jgi:hypothetical protein
MREIRLQDCETIVLSLPGETARRASASALCDRLGLTYRIMDAIRCSPGAIGCGLSHIKALRGWGGQTPLLVLEDDVAASDDYAPAITVPGDADAVYLGVSRYGAVEPVDFAAFGDMIAAEPIGDGLARIYNMFGAHAVLHLTDRWRRAAVEAMMGAMVDRNWPPDRGLARIQGDFNVYAFELPAFYQSAALQPEGRGRHQEDVTRARLPVFPVGAVASIELASARRDVRLVRDGARLRWVWAD